MKKKIKWNELKEKISNFTKMALMLYMMTQGFLITYYFFWTKAGFPVNNWAVVVLCGAAFLSEYRFYRWTKG